MKRQDQNSADKRQKVLTRLRQQFGEDRNDETEEVDSFDSIATFLRLADLETGEDDDGDDWADMQEQLRTLRDRRRKLQAAQPSESGEPEEDEFHSISVGEIIRDLPRIRDSIGNWLRRVDGDFVPNETPLTELERYLDDVQFRMKVLTVWSRATRQELDDLQAHIQARRAAGKE